MKLEVLPPLKGGNSESLIPHKEKHIWRRKCPPCKEITISRFLFQAVIQLSQDEGMKSKWKLSKWKLSRWKGEEMGGVVWLRAAASGSQMGWKLSSVGTCATFHASSSSLLLRVLKRITRMQNCPADIRMFYFLFWYCLVTTLTLNLGGGRWDGRWEGGWGGERGGGGGGGASPSNDGWQFLQFTDRTKFAGGSKKRRIHLTGEEWSGREDFEEKKSFFATKMLARCWTKVA